MNKIEPIPYPIIDENEDGSPIRLFDENIVRAVRESIDSILEYWEEQLEYHQDELVRISVPGYRHPNPTASVAGSIAYHNYAMIQCRDTVDRLKKNSISYDNLTFAEKISEQMWLVCMPAPPDDEMTIRFEEYIRRMTAECEIIQLWNSL